MPLVTAATESPSRSRPYANAPVTDPETERTTLALETCVVTRSLRRLFCFACVFLCALMAWAPSVSAQAGGTDAAEVAEAARGLKIESIDVAGNRRVGKEDVLAYLRERPGQTFSPEVLARDVRELWASGFFDAITHVLTTTGRTKLSHTGYFFTKAHTACAVNATGQFSGNQRPDVFIHHDAFGFYIVR